MKTIFVTRHQGAQEWARQTGVVVDQWETHLDPLAVSSGDTVIGVLPVALAAEVCARGARFFELVVALPAALRGKELSADQLFALGARLMQYHVVEVT